jgi:hypothetical protein
VLFLKMANDMAICSGTSKEKLRRGKYKLYWDSIRIPGEVEEIKNMPD